jgi:Domain of unknown function (DUF4160)
MVVVHRAHGFRFVIYTFDHEPAHVHVYGAGQAKILLVGAEGLPEMVTSAGMKNNDKLRVIGEVMDRIANFQAKWDEIHG